MQTYRPATILIFALLMPLAGCTTTGSQGFKKFLRAELVCPDPPPHFPEDLKAVKYVRIVHPVTGRVHLAYRSGTDYQNHAHNGVVMERAVEALAIQRDHYYACIDRYNQGQ